GLAVVAAFVHQMLRRDGRPRLVESVSGVVAGVVVVVTAALWVDVSAADGGRTLVLVAAAGLTLAAVWTALPVSVAVLASGAALLAGGGGLLVAHLLPGVELAVAAAVGAGAGLFTAVLHTLLGRSPHVSRPLAGLGAAMLPVLVGSVPAYLAAQLL
ncbi:hypothetical protein PU560_12150, partial [Georgenia sp. 10Sc9-8]|nr:hypothetical protein [Georgenia halotolerans]